MKFTMPAGMVIEFMGAPGAGKSTLMSTVKEFFHAQGSSARSTVEASRHFALRTQTGRLVRLLTPASLHGPLLWQVFYQSSKMQRATFRRKHPALMRSVLSFQQTRPITAADREHVLHWFINLTGQYQFLTTNAGPADVLLFDEGFAHRVVQLFASESESPNLERVRAYLDLIPKPDLIIHPRASLPTCIQRVRQRGVWERFRSKGDDALVRFMENAHTIVNFAVNHLIVKGWDVVEVDNDRQPIPQAAASLQQKLASMSVIKDEFVALPMGI